MLWYVEKIPAFINIADLFGTASEYIFTLCSLGLTACFNNQDSHAQT